MPRIIIFLLPLFFGISQSAAHETWLASSAFAAAPGDKVILSLTSGGKFPELDYAIRPERIVLARSRCNKIAADLPGPARGNAALRFEQSFPAAGLVTAWVTLAPKAHELSTAKVAEYFEEIDASAEVRQRWADLRASTDGRNLTPNAPRAFCSLATPPSMSPGRNRSACRSRSCR